MRRGASAALLLAAALSGCAVKGYEIGWRNDDPVAQHLGRPLDPLAGCRFAEGAATVSGACAEIARRISATAAALPPSRAAPEALGARCVADACSYANVFERRDVGLALVLPVFRKVVLREARMRFVRNPAGPWRLDALSITDVPPPAYGPVRIGAFPPP